MATPAASAQVPVALPDSFEVRPGLTLEVAAPGVLVNDFGAPGDSLVAVPTSAPTSGLLELRPDGSLSYVADPSFLGTALFHYETHRQTTEVLAVDATRSVVSLFADVDTPIGSDDAEAESRVSGGVFVDVIPNRGPFVYSRVENVQLALADTTRLSFRFRRLGVTLGRLEVLSLPDSIQLAFSETGAAAAVEDSLFLQAPNKVRLTGTVALTGTDLLDPVVPDGPQRFDTETDFDIEGLIEERNDSLHLSLPVRFEGTFELSGVQVDLRIEGLVVASGPLLPVVASLPTEVAIRVDPQAVDIEARDAPGAPVLLEAYPNPFSSRLTVRLTLDEPAVTRFTLTDALGRRVASLEPGWLPAGAHRLAFSDLDLAPGVYVLTLRPGERRAALRLVAVR